MRVLQVFGEEGKVYNLILQQKCNIKSSILASVIETSLENTEI